LADPAPVGPPPHKTPAAPAPPPDDATLIAQSIKRFEGAYRSRGGSFALEDCQVSPDRDSATATCRARQSDASTGSVSDGPWTFTLRKFDEGWRIVSVVQSARTGSPRADESTDGRPDARLEGAAAGQSPRR
jgi:hypothetical protein